MSDRYERDERFYDVRQPPRYPDAHLGERGWEFAPMDAQSASREHPTIQPSAGPGASARRSVDEGPYRGKGPKGYRRSDERIREEVCDRLTDDSNLDPSQVEVTVDDGEVTLGGTVKDRWSKRRAEACADAVRGVEDVHNRLRHGRGGDPSTAGR